MSPSSDKHLKSALAVKEFFTHAEQEFILDKIKENPSLLKGLQKISASRLPKIKGTLLQLGMVTFEEHARLPHAPPGLFFILDDTAFLALDYDYQQSLQSLEVPLPSLLKLPASHLSLLFRTENIFSAHPPLQVSIKAPPPAMPSMINSCFRLDFLHDPAGTHLFHVDFEWHSEWPQGKTGQTGKALVSYRNYLTQSENWKMAQNQEDKIVLSKKIRPHKPSASSYKL